jgi:hypothetical protein
MVSYSVYRVVHLLGIFLLLVVLGAAARTGVAGTDGTGPGAVRSRRMGAVLHGLALFIILLGGFGLLARIGVMHGMSWPGWVWAKLGIWLLLGAMIIVPRRKPAWAGALLLAVPLVSGLAAWLAIFKPF